MGYQSINTETNMKAKWLLIAAGIALLLGILNGWPYAYYILLRWFICGTAIFCISGFLKAKLTGWAIVFGALAFLFNPLFPVYMNKSSWVGIDLISAIVFFLAVYAIKKKSK